MSKQLSGKVTISEGRYLELLNSSCDSYAKDIASVEFLECGECKTKPGSPTLCYACLHNRGVASRLRKALKDIQILKRQLNDR